MTQAAVGHSPFSFPLFRAVWTATLVSNFGGMIQTVGASWMIVSLGGSVAMVALVQTSSSLPVMLLSLVAGALADNFDRRRLMLAAQCIMMSASLLLAIGAWAGLLTPWLLLAFTFLIGCGNALRAPAWQASVGDMVPRPAIPAAVAMNSMGFNLARTAGPAAGGAIVAAAGAATAFLLNALSYIGLIAVLARWQPPEQERRGPREPIGEAMMAGIRYVRMSGAIRRAVWRTFLFGLAASAIPAMIPLVARDLVQGGPLTYGFLLGGFGTGAVCGALGTRRLRAHLSVEQIVRCGAIALSIGGAVSAVSSSVALTLAAIALAGAGWIVSMSTFNVCVQLDSPRWAVARTISIYQAAMFGSLALGSWIVGMVADRSSVGEALLAAAALQLLSVLAGLRWPLEADGSTDLEPFTRWREPNLALPVESVSGPVAILIEYRIEPANQTPFLAAMKERRRIRLRDGARDWSLAQDVSHPALWIERFRVSNWAAYIRYHERRTKADTGISETIRALSIGEPTVHRLIERPLTSRSTQQEPVYLEV